MRIGRKAWHKYRDFISGEERLHKTKDKEIKERQMMSEIDFVQATKPLAKLMKRMEVIEVFDMETRKTNINGNPKNRSAYESMLYLSHQMPNQLCYTRKSINKTGYRKISEKLTFGSGVYRTHLSDMYFYVHHPGQYHRKSSPVLRIDLMQHSITLNNYNYDIEITQTDIMRKRADANEPCNYKIDTNDDKHWMQSAIEIVKCVPPFWKAFYEWQNSTFSTCKTSKQFKMVANLVKDPSKRSKVISGYKQPCAEMSVGVIKNEFEDNFLNFREFSPGKGNLSVIIKYSEDTYHEIVNMQQVTMDSFWSSTGGFVGMFLGYSVMQVPHFIFGIVMWSTNKNN